MKFKPINVLEPCRSGRQFKDGTYLKKVNPFNSKVTKVLVTPKEVIHQGNQPQNGNLNPKVTKVLVTPKEVIYIHQGNQPQNDNLDPKVTKVLVTPKEVIHPGCHEWQSITKVCELVLLDQLAHLGATNHVVFEKELEKRTEPRQVRGKIWIIGRSSSLSNMPKINSAAQRRCSSVPPTITVQYLLPSTTHNERAHSYNLLSDGPDSYDGDFSGTDSDVTYCPTDVEILSDSSSPDILEEPSTSSGIMSEPIFRSLSNLYSYHKEYCAENGEPIVCRFTFEKLSKDKNLSLYTLKKDMCDVCSGHAVGNINTSDYEQHIKRKDRARLEKENDKKQALTGNFILLSMDLEAVKVSPYLTASALYFKTQLTCHNFTVYDLITHQASCYWFDETSADLTASTFASFVIDYLERYCLPKGAYSTCT
ncbi:unnamed protein product [Arctia plantaginis]|uniref:Uncharacterized protein n=1 Tax=Arctia plantaginis TaxID=874455 RepID=A0A8S1AR58_ARCPL|nr:unnamed protein product [Arctia plantaginis]